jgi:hypothetical protein
MTAKQPRKRCRYQVWERGRGIRSYQCQQAAKHERDLYERAVRIDGVLLEARIERLPVCGTHARTVDRDPRPEVHVAYRWTESDGVWSAHEEEWMRDSRPVTNPADNAGQEDGT